MQPPPTPTSLQNLLYRIPQKSRVTSKANPTRCVVVPNPASQRTTPSHSNASPTVTRVPGVAAHRVPATAPARHPKATERATGRDPSVPAGGRRGKGEGGGGALPRRRACRPRPAGGRPVAAHADAVPVREASAVRHVIVPVVAVEFLRRKRVEERRDHGDVTDIAHLAI